MSSGVPVMNFDSIANFATDFQNARREQKLAKLGEQIGPKLQAGDYQGASSLAFEAGDAQSGLQLLKLGETYRQTRLGEQAADRFVRGLPGGGYGDDVAPAPRGGLGSLGSSLPSFAQGSDIGRYASAIQANESGGNYGALGPKTRTGDRAYGAYQVMGANVGPWTEEVLGHRMTPDEFRADRGAQDVVFQAKFGQSVARYGNPQDAASVWFTGRPLAQGANARDVLGTTGQEYVRRFNAGLLGGGGRQPDLPVTAMQMPAGSESGAPMMARTPAGRVQVASLDPSAGLPVDGMNPRATPPALPSPRLPSANADGRLVPGRPPASAMQMPTEAPVQVAQAGGSPVSDAAMIGNVPAGALRAERLAPRIQFLERAIVTPHLPEGMREGAKILLREAYDQTKMSDEVKEYRIARTQGYGGTLLDWKRETKEGNPRGFTTLNGRLIYTDKSTGQTRDATPEGLPPTWRPLTPQERQSLGVRDDASVFMTPDGPKSLAGQTINVGGAERAQDAAIGADYGKRFVEMQRGAQAARSTTTTVDRMEAAMNSPGFYSGTGGQARLAFNRALDSVGIKDKATAAPAEVFEALSNRLILDGLGGSLGTGISNGDRDFIQRTAPTLTNTMAGNRELLRIARAVAQRQEQVAKLARDYAQANGGRLNMGFDERLAEWAEANPLLPGSRAQQSGEDPRRTAAPTSGPSARAVDYLRANPNLRGDFDEKFGAGAADSILGPAQRGGPGLDPSLGLQ